MKLTAQIEIKCPPTGVWEIINAPAASVLWQEGYESTVMKQGLPNEPGSIANHLFRDKGKKLQVTETVIERKEPSVIKSTLVYPVMNQEIAYTLDGQEHTHLTCDITVQLTAFSLRLFAPWLKKSFQEKLDSDLQHLKSIIEG